jgi:hypothetical protein
LTVLGAWTQEPHAYWTDALPFKPHAPPALFAVIMLEIRSHAFAWVSLDLDPSYSLFSLDWDDRHTPLLLGFSVSFVKMSSC